MDLEKKSGTSNVFESLQNVKQYCRLAHPRRSDERLEANSAFNANDER